eukprot:g18370.t1
MGQGLMAGHYVPNLNDGGGAYGSAPNDGFAGGSVYGPRGDAYGPGGGVYGPGSDAYGPGGGTYVSGDGAYGGAYGSGGGAHNPTYGFSGGARDPEPTDATGGDRDGGGYGGYEDLTGSTAQDSRADARVQEARSSSYYRQQDRRGAGPSVGRRPDVWSAGRGFGLASQRSSVSRKRGAEGAADVQPYRLKSPRRDASQFFRGDDTFEGNNTYPPADAPRQEIISFLRSNNQCYKRVFSGKCNRPSCPFDHEIVPAGFYNAISRERREAAPHAPPRQVCASMTEAAYEYCLEMGLLEEPTDDTTS